MSSNRSASLARIGRLNGIRDCADRVDYDYLEKLSPEELAWLANFSDDYCTGPGAKRYARRTDLTTMTYHRVPIKENDLPQSPSPEHIFLAIEKKSRRKRSS